MPTDRVLFAPPVTSFAALGAESLDDLFEPERLATWSRAERLATESGDLIARVPLPGTPDSAGRVRERPRGAGTGFVRLRLFRTRFAAGMRARLSHPRSQSLAERRWNLACQMREAGVATPDLMLVGARGAGFFSQQSVLIVRELSELLSLERWLQAELSEQDRALGVRAVEHALTRLERSRVVLPELELRDIFVHLPKGSDQPCTNAVDDSSAPGRLERLPGVVIASLRGGYRSAKPIDPRAREVARRINSAIQTHIGSANSSTRHVH